MQDHFQSTEDKVLFEDDGLLDFESLDDIEQPPVAPKPNQALPRVEQKKMPRPLLGLTPTQRFILSVMLLVLIGVLSILILLVTNRIVI